MIDPLQIISLMIIIIQVIQVIGSFVVWGGVGWEFGLLTKFDEGIGVGQN